MCGSLRCGRVEIMGLQKCRIVGKCQPVLIMMVSVALQCVRSVPKERPSMVKACTTLEQIKASLPAVHGDRQHA
jgi:hypothetical protein